MAIPVPAKYTKAAPTFFKAVRPSDASELTTSTTYVDVPNFAAITSVPNGAKILFAGSLTKSTAGNGLLRLTDGTNTFKEFTKAVSDPAQMETIDGTTLQNSGGAATVKVQFKSDDGNNVTTRPEQSFILCTDGDLPLVMKGAHADSIIRIPMKVSISKIYLFAGEIATPAGDAHTLNGFLNYVETGDNVVKSDELTHTYPNEQIFNYMEIRNNAALAANQYVIVDWSGHGASFS